MARDARDAIPLFDMDAFAKRAVHAKAARLIVQRGPIGSPEEYDQAFGSAPAASICVAGSPASSVEIVACRTDTLRRSSA